MSKQRNRLVDLRCAWKKADDVEREKFLRWLLSDEAEEYWPMQVPRRQYPLPLPAMDWSSDGSEPLEEPKRPRDCDKCGRRLLPVGYWGNSQYLYMCEECARVEAPHQFTLAAQVKQHLDEGAAKRRREQEGQED